VFVNSQVSSHVSFGSSNSKNIFAHTLNVYATDRLGFFAILQFRGHEAWTRFFASSLEERLRYTPSDCFETFPFPADWETEGELERVGREYFDYRAGLMGERGEGLTKTYNRFHNPEETDPGTLRLRELHGAMDAAVLRAYGWGDLVDAGRTACAFVPDFYDEAEEGGDPVPRSLRYRWSDATRDEVLARLLALNAQRAAEESTAAPASTPTPSGPRRGRAAQPELLPPPQGDLFA
jgi:hypothetical protein